MSGFVSAIVIVLVACANGATPTPNVRTPVPTLTKPITTIATTPHTATATRAAETPTRATPTQTRVPPTATAHPTATATKIPPSPVAKKIDALESETRAGWEQFVASIQADANPQARVDALWKALVKNRRIPLSLDDAVVFLYKGNASSVLWRGDFSYWQLGKGIDGTRVGQTDLWYGIANFPRDSRTEYEILLNGTQAITDPANPNKHKGGFGYNSVLTMPDFSVTDFSTARVNIPHGNLTDWITFDSKAWGAPINYRVYTPPNYDALQNLPVVYVTDGNDYSDPEMGGTQTIIDNLLADGKISPLIAVFIDARNPKNLKDNQREIQFLARPEDFAKFIATELVPTIDAQYHTNASREGRTLMGVSFGGAFTTYAGLRYQDVFGNLAIYSPAYWVYQSQVAAGAPRMSAFVDKALAMRGTMPSKIFMSAGLTGWDVGDMQPWAKRFQQHGDTIQLFHSQEGHSWSAWSGLTDEMLEYFFGV